LTKKSSEKTKHQPASGSDSDRKKSKKPAPEEGRSPVDTDAEGIEQRLGELEEELARVREEASDANDRALRLLAEFDTYRRRNEKERAAAAGRGAAEVLTELLEVADNFDRALEHAGDGVPEAFLDGMRLVSRGLHDLLDRRGVARIETIGETFDPALHEALSTVPSDDAEPNTIVEEVQPGYTMNEKVLRPAKVIVARVTDGNAR